MFNKLNFRERMLFRLILMIVLIMSMAVFSCFGFYYLDASDKLWQAWLIPMISLFVITIVLEIVMSKWAMQVIDKPIKGVRQFSMEASQVIERASRRHEFAVNKQLELIKDTGSTVKKLSRNSEETERSAQRVADKSNIALQMSEKGQEAMRVNIRNMMVLRQKIEAIAHQILELSEHTQQIGSIVGVVDDITEQTNMLALNAAVEAARAGEHGRGFAVVASEIRKLSDQCKQATMKITALINDIQQATNSTVMATEEGTKEIEAGVDLANQVADTINALRATMQDTVEAVEIIVSVSKQQFKSTKEFSEVMYTINSGIEEAVAAIERSKQVLQMLNNISQSIQDI